MCELSEKEHGGTEAERERERERVTEVDSKERCGKAQDLLASFLGTLSLTTIQFAFYPINRASRRAFPDTHGYVFPREFFITLPHEPHNGECRVNSPNMTSVLPLITSIILLFFLPSPVSFLTCLARNDEIIFLFANNHKGARFTLVYDKKHWVS